jgi:hypothetical protein
MYFKKKQPKLFSDISFSFKDLLRIFQKKKSSSLTAASITLHFKTFYSVTMKIIFCKIIVKCIQKKNAYKNKCL